MEMTHAMAFCTFWPLLTITLLVGLYSLPEMQGYAIGCQMSVFSKVNLVNI